MEIIKKPKELTSRIDVLKKEEKTIGLIPTMGYLHEGHVSLIKKAREGVDVLILSIFVNPTQFGPSEDYKNYPQDLLRDTKIAQKEGVDIIFAPHVKDMYPEEFSTYVEEISLSKGLEGKFRPTHFRGVATVVLKLFNIVKPHIAYFGQKDWQQAIIIKRMVKDLNIDTEIKILPIIREENGLAMSSRNNYLNKKEKKSAAILYRSLIEAKKMIEGGVIECSKIKRKMGEIIKREPFTKIDYIEICEPEALEAVEKIKGGGIILLAVWIGRVRLIDNVLITKEEKVLTEDQKRKLLRISRQTLKAYINKGKVPSFTEDDPTLRESYGAFVTLRIGKSLRGCIGQLTSNQPLYELIRGMTIASSTQDPRFPPVNGNELKNIKIEISVVSKPKKIKNIDEFELGRHGVIVKKGFNQGVFLPQVATETGWSKEKFLSNLCSHKACLTPDAWKDEDTEIYIFSAEVFEEE